MLLHIGLPRGYTPYTNSSREEHTSATVLSRIVLCGVRERCLAMETWQKKPSHKEWRRVAKRERRRRLRRLAAAQRDTDAQELTAALEATAAYSNWVEQQRCEEEEREKREREEHDLQEKLWLEEEARAQKEWRILQERKLKARQQQLEQDAKIREEFEAKQQAIRKKQEEDKRKQEEELKKREDLLQEIDDYIDNGIKTPEALREMIDSQPGKELCPFFTKTGACRYGNTCSRNHRRVCLSKVILVPGFYAHFSLEKNSAEYDTDIGLEFENSETRQHFDEFYKDVIPELESYGRIKTFKTCYNTEIHLRGNLYVEYYTEREAARVVRSLKGRWYAGRQLNCEFCNLKSWRSAVCGTSKCPKGRACNFLHTFRNPHDEYGIKSPPRWAKQAANQDATNSRRSEHRSKSKWAEVSGSETSERKNWRWSESPEPDVESRSRRSEKRRHRSSERNQSQKSDRDKKYTRSHRSPERKHKSEKSRDIKDARDTSRSSSSKSRRSKDYDSDHSESKRSHRSYSNGRSDTSSHARNERSYESERRRQCSDRERKRHKSHKYSEQEDSKTSSKASSKSKDRSNSSGTKGSKSKWDKEEYESDSSGSSSSSSSSGDSEEITEEKKPNEVGTSVIKDEWATTDTESEDNERCPT